MVQTLLAFSMPSVPVMAEQPARAESAAVQMNNIVLFAQYDALSASNFMEDRAENIASMCNDADTFHSLSGYIDAISYGKLNVTSYFPQMHDGVITPYVLSSAAKDYANCEQIAIDMLRNITISDDIPLDGNADGIVDNVIFVIDGKADDMSSPIWPRAFSVNGMKLNGLSVNRVNIQNSAQLFDNIVTGAEGVLCHEFLHSLGYPDLYHNERTGNPVGLWDIMAANSVFLQYPLAYQRAKISGWLDSKDIKESGTYTLSPTSADSGNRLYLLKTPLSDTEFFAVEYRQQGKRYSDELDVKIYGTGLVVYRVNTEQDGNFKGDQDEIYVFRPGETALDAGEGDLFSSNYGGENAPDSVGSLDWNADITDGALVYSNGTNSGICISDIVMDETSLTFSVDFADTAETKLWESVSSESLGVSSPYELAASADGTVYMITSDDAHAVLYRMDGKALTAVGEPLGSGSSVDMNQPTLAICGNTPYVLYQDKDFLLHLCRYDCSTGGWTDVYQGTAFAQYAALTADETKLYVAYTTGNFPYALHAVCYDCEAGTVTALGETITANACGMSAAVLNGTPAVAYRDLNDGSKAKLAVYHEGNWDVKTVSETACGTVSMVSDGTTAWIAPSGSGNAVYRFSSGQLTAYPLPDTIAENAFVQVPVLADEQCCLAVNTQNPDELAVYSLNGTDWELVGNTLAMDVVNSLSLAYSGQTLYCSCFTTNGTAIIRQLQLGTGASEPLVGDVNADGRFSVADVVMMQKWLLGSGGLTDWKAGDLYQDDRIDVFDLCIMKRMLVRI